MADATNTEMIVLWLRVLQVISLDSPLAFPDFEGKPMAHLERRVKKAAKFWRHVLPNATAFHKEVEIRNKRQEGPLREAVSRALSHSLATAQQYYQAPTLHDAYMAYGVMQDIIGGERAVSPGAESSPSPEQKGKGRKRGKGKFNL